jgi:hypothetical protein
VATWNDVERVALTLPETSLGEAHEGSPAVLVGTQQFARLRWDEAGGEVLQFWVPDADLVDAFVRADPQTYWGASGFSKKVVMARLSALDGVTLRELLVESWSSRAPVSLRKRFPELR